MLEAIVLKLVTSLTGFLFEGYLDTFRSIEVEGAPSWYEKSGNPEYLVGYGYAQGGIESINSAKTQCQANLILKINKGVNAAITQNFQYVKDPKEQALIDAFKNDAGLAQFVDQYVRYEKVEHFEAQSETLFKKAHPAQTFSGCAIPKQMILEYEKGRLGTIKYNLSTFRSNNADNELDTEMNGL